MTIALQEVAVLLDLQIDGPTITGKDDRDWAFECERLLGRVPPQTAIKCGAVSCNGSVMSARWSQSI